MSDWQPIETAPKNIVFESSMVSGEKRHQYGPIVLVYMAPSFNYAMARWWQISDGGDCNWLDAGRAIRPTHWMPLPAPPEAA